MTRLVRRAERERERGTILRLIDDYEVHSVRDVPKCYFLNLPLLTCCGTSGRWVQSETGAPE